MKKVLAALAILILVVVVIWMNLAKKAQGEDLDKELGTTVDDGEAADFVELQQSAEGL